MVFIVFTTSLILCLSLNILLQNSDGYKSYFTISTACRAFLGLNLTQTHTLTLCSPYQNGSQSPTGSSSSKVKTVPGYSTTTTGHSSDKTGHTLPLTASLTMASAGSVGVGATVGVDEGRCVGVVVGIGVEVADRVSVGVTVGSGVDIGGMSVSVGSGDGMTIGGDVGEAGKMIVLVGYR